MSALPWQRSQWQRLMDAFVQNRLPHGILLTGPVGLGKQRMANALADVMLCEAIELADRPCGECGSCHLRRHQSHPDFTRVEPPEGKQLIPIDQIRALCGSLSLKSHRRGYQVALIAPADALTASAANSLLKTLEEPAPETLLLLVTARPAALPATILSRAHHVQFSIPNRSVSLGWLQSEDRQLDWGRSLDFAGGAPLAAMRLAEIDFVTTADQLSDDLQGIIAGRRDPVEIAAQWAKLEPRLSLGWLSGWVEALIRARSIGKIGAGVYESVLKPLQKQMRNINLQRLFEYSDELRAANRLDAQLNTQLTLESLLIPWACGLLSHQQDLK